MLVWTVSHRGRSIDQQKTADRRVSSNRRLNHAGNLKQAKRPFTSTQVMRTGACSKAIDAEQHVPDDVEQRAVRLHAVEQDDPAAARRQSTCRARSQAPPSALKRSPDRPRKRRSPKADDDVETAPRETAAGSRRGPSTRIGAATAVRDQTLQRATKAQRSNANRYRQPTAADAKHQDAEGNASKRHLGQRDEDRAADRTRKHHREVARDTAPTHTAAGSGRPTGAPHRGSRAGPQRLGERPESAGRSKEGQARLATR